MNIPEYDAMKGTMTFMETTLLTTKLTVPPRRQQLILRPRLLADLQQCLDFNLTLISAPAGFGKTTLVSEWIQQTSIEAAWLSLDTDDDDPPRFWEYFIAALRTIRPDIGDISRDLLKAQSALPVASVLTPLINDLSAIERDFIVVLDDYHFIQSESIHSGITFLIEHLPTRMHLIIAT
jgi:LuxR family maltose regulon positive regulatory protein